MARVLHLLDKLPDYQTQTAVSQLTRGSAHAAIRTIGRGGDFGTALLAATKLRRHVETFDLIHAWGRTALSIAAIGCRKPIVYSPTQFPGRRDLRWLRAVMAIRPVQVVCTTNTARRRFVEGGVAVERCHLIRPGVNFARVNYRRDPDLRRRLGFDDDDTVLLACGESTRAANHHAASLAAAVLHVFQPKYKLLLWGRGEHFASERSYARQMLPDRFVSIATDAIGNDIAFDDLLPATDIVLITASGPVATLPIAVCMAAGLPIVAVASVVVAELLQDRHNALLVKDCRSRALARRVLDLQEDPRLRWQICDTARAEAYEHFPMTGFVEQFHTLYEQTAGKPAGGPHAGGL